MMIEKLFDNLVLDFTLANSLLIFASSILALSVLMLIKAKNLVESIIYLSIFSLLISICYLLMDAPDVAMTEVALGSCLSTAILLNFIRIVSKKDEGFKNKRYLASLALCFALAIALLFAASDIPSYGEKTTSLQRHVNQYYLENTKKDIGIPSFVAAILASYRGYDTLGETSVILIAGLSVLLILSNKKQKEDDSNV